MSDTILTHSDVLRFWFEETSPAQWFGKSDELDYLISRRFSSLHAMATHGELYEWRETARGRLAEIIVLDQFSRNMYRGKPLSFAFDTLALALAQEAIRAGADNELSQTERSFLYMPFMHSESLVIHKRAVLLLEKNGAVSILQFELKHKAIIEQFGRYPHRNSILGRESSMAELEFLASNPGF